MTLVFLGSRTSRPPTRIAEAAFGALPGGRAAAADAPTGASRSRRATARLFALDLDDEGGRAGALQAAMSDALEAGGCTSPRSARSGRTSRSRA